VTSEEASRTRSDASDAEWVRRLPIRQESQDEPRNIYRLYLRGYKAIEMKIKVGDSAMAMGPRQRVGLVTV
jgi:hypothetical protein